MREGSRMLRIGIDVGSTTLKIVVLDVGGEILHKSYIRHKADFNRALVDCLSDIRGLFLEAGFAVNITGSAGMGISERTGIPFIQEVVASVEVVKKFWPGVRTLIDLGGEDAKMVFFGEGRQPDIRMNGNCAGGTGAFIDQMADLMNIQPGKLSELADAHEKIYPVASRCGVFAKTDIQNLLSRNVPRADVAMSILHAVALQSITALARGRHVEPEVICIGGPLTFIPALRDAFRNIMHFDRADIIAPDNGEFFPAWGAALSVAVDGEASDLTRIIDDISRQDSVRTDVLPALFSGEEEYTEWKRNRRMVSLKQAVPADGSALDCYLGIDSGSTTTKIIVTDTDSAVIFSHYESNEGNPLRKAVEGMRAFYDEMGRRNITARFLSTAVTGYGEELIKAALDLDYGIVETMAHLCGAQYVDPQVSFILDIGGQDMKSLFVHNGLISNVELNEACSSGCGSFLQNFASTMDMTLEEFTRSACTAKYPGDLGTRCTVFMNSKVKQLLRENASFGDIAAGLAYSVVKNCLFKVLKIANLNALGDNIVVQGGTFRNDAVYRALEMLSGKQVSSTDRPDMMGAFGAALYAKQKYESDGAESRFTGVIPEPGSMETTDIACHGCTNACSVMRFRFANDNTYFSGNKCEKVFYNKATAPDKGFNAFELKNRLLFERCGKKNTDSKRLRIGIPRVLNMYENYPFWHTLFEECGLETVLSPESNFGLYRKGVGAVMSENICFPAKLAHGHIVALAEMGVDRIFYPMIVKEEKELGASCNSFNCPIVSGYPDVIRSSMDPADEMGIPLDKPVMTFNNEKALRKTCREYLASLGVDRKTAEKAFDRAVAEKNRFQAELIAVQKDVLDKALRTGQTVFVVAGRPYHADTLINQKTGQILSDLGVQVLTDDVFRKGAAKGFADLTIVSQWSYPNRVVQAAMEIAKLPQNVQLVQLNSFGCGPDSFFMEEVTSLLRNADKPHTIIRIDEIASPGSVRLRLRSLLESLRAAGAETIKAPEKFCGYETVYRETDKRKTIILPWLADFISPFVPAIGALAGYKFVNLPKSDKASAETGLKYGHNEVCYPSTLVTGDIIKALQSGEYDLGDTVVAITQTGGQCRATNYVSQIKYALKNAGFGCIPMVILSAGKAYQNEQSAFSLPVAKLIDIGLYTVLYGDALNQLYSRTVIREKKHGASRSLFDKYVDEGIKAIEVNDCKKMLAALEKAVSDFNALEVFDREYTAVGLVGEIFVKYNDYGQAHITEWLRSHGMEVMTPPILDFVMQYFVNSEVNVRNGVRRGSLMKYWLNPPMRKYLYAKINRVERIMEHFKLYHRSESVFEKAEYASEILDLSNQFGEGWSLAGEVACYARGNVSRVVCVQPFGCIANHVIAKGIEKRMRKIYPHMNILYLDVDSGVGDVNMQNRLSFLIREDAPAEAI